MISRTNVLVGGNFGQVVVGSPTATIKVITLYPIGSTCTCTSGTKIYESGSTIGVCVFYLKDAGTYIISCTNGTDTASQTISVTDNNIYHVELLYELRLYYYGDENTAVTGGWEFARNTSTWDSSAKYSDYLYLTSTLAASGSYLCTQFQTLSPIDITPYNTCEVLTVVTGDLSGTRNDLYCLTNPTRIGVDNLTNDANTVIDRLSTEHYNAFSIANLTGNHYFRIHAKAIGGSHSIQVAIKSVILRR